MKKMILALLAIAAFAGAAIAAESCGVVERAEGSFGTTRDGAFVALALGDEIFEFDVIKTEAGGSGTIRFVDDTTLEIRESSEIEIKEVVSTESRNRFNVGVIEGAARVITGEIVRRNPKGFRVTTPKATVGIRGTTIEVAYDPAAERTEVFVDETEKSVTFTDRETGVSFTGGTGLSITLENDGSATVNGVSASTADASSLAAAADRLASHGVSVNDRTGSDIGSSQQNSGGSDYGIGDGGDGSSSDGGSSAPSGDGGCGDSISSPGR